MSLSKRSRRDDITYWAPSGQDAYANRTFAVPVALKGKWEDIQELFIDAAGNEVRSRASVYVGQDLLNEGWLFLGTSTVADPTAVSGAYEIRSFSKIRTISSAKAERRAML